MSTGSTMTFHLPPGWTLRKVATSLANKWLPPFRAVPVVKAARWVVQPVVEYPGETQAPLWERGISTEEYEERLDRADVCWAIRARTGRSSGTILARIAMRSDNPGIFQIACSQNSLPETLFDAEKVEHLVKDQEATPGSAALFNALLTEHGFQHANI